jgi:hypothetical protein
LNFSAAFNLPITFKFAGSMCTLFNDYALQLAQLSVVPGYVLYKGDAKPKEVCMKPIGTLRVLAVLRVLGLSDYSCFFGLLQS